MAGNPGRFNKRDYITPEAFSVQPELLGTPLARPSKRLLAWLLDALVVALIGTLGNVLLALALALLFDRILRQTELPFAQRWREQLRIGVVAAFVIWAAVQAFSQWGAHHGTKRSSATPAASSTKVPKEDHARHLTDDKDDDKDEAENKPSDAERIEELNKEVEDLEKPRSFSLLDSLKNILGDVGFDFGWAAVYWTLITGWWNGQTLGKRLFGLRVVQLNGKPLSLWDSFNRCGGYAAGLATGLLGFVQVLWDDNRQAIHDKVSFTVVVDERRSKIAWPPADFQN
jgi:uncharacterized RDD family membrane protein YckC